MIINKVFNKKNILLVALCHFSFGLFAAEANTTSDRMSCNIQQIVPARPVVEDELEFNDTHVLSDDFEVVEDDSFIFRGGVEVTHDKQQLLTDYFLYNQKTDEVNTKGDTKYWDEELFLQGHDLTLFFDDETGKITNVDFFLFKNKGRGSANNVVFKLGVSTELEKDVNYSLCTEEDDFWRLTAKRVLLDYKENLGKAYGAVLRIKNIPVFYTPYISFPLSEKRKSGFLAPEFGSTNRHGFELKTPYYWNISPNMDATLAPRLLTDSGVMAVGEYRYLFKDFSGELNFEYLPNDSIYNNEKRYALSITHKHNLLKNGRLFINYNRVSDRDYFEDFGNQLSVTSNQYVEQRADFSYRLDGFYFLARVQGFQSTSVFLNPENLSHKRLPQIVLNYNSPRRANDFNYGFNSETVYFKRDGDANNVNGLRVSFNPHISYLKKSLAGYVEPKLSFGYTQYRLSDSIEYGKNPSRFLPKFSLDSGVFLERQINLFGNSILQTLEPRFFYLYVPNENQDDIPIFDTGEIDFSYSSLFYDNSFSGKDRQNDANQLTLAATSRFINKDTGRSLGSMKLGQIFYFQDREVTLPNRNTDDSPSSELIAEANISLIKDWNIAGTIVFDPNRHESTRKFIMRASYSPANGKILNLAYRVNRDIANDINNIEQSNVSFSWPISSQINAVGSWVYATSEGKSLDLFGGIEYEDCCWGARVVVRRFLTGINSEYKTGVFLQLELKGLTGIGNSTGNFLREHILGYKNEF